MLAAAEFIATFCCALFAGAALYVNLVEHPARLTLETRAALAEWAPSYHRGTLMQAPLALVAFLAALAAWWLGREPGWLVAALAILAPVPFTFIAILPTNRRLLEPGRDPNSADTRSLLQKWGALHAVRTAAGIVSLGLMLWLLLRGG